MRRSWLPAWLGLAFLTPSVALAANTHEYPECVKSPSETDVSAAKGAFQAGMVSFNEADYARATLYWEDAFRRDCTATLLLHHLARAYEGANQLEQAVIALRTYLERSPDASDRAQLQRRLKVFEEKLAETKSGATTPTPAASTPAAQNTTTPSTPDEPTSSHHEEVTGTEATRYLPLAVAAAGVLTAGVGGVLWLKKNSDFNDDKDQCPNNICPTETLRQQASDDQSARNTFAWVTGFGAAVALGGGLWYFIAEEHRASTTTTASTRVLPVTAPGFAGFSMTGSF